MISTINIYSNIKQTTGGKDIPIDIFLDNIKDGKWQDLVLPIRALKEEKEIEDAKKKVPYVTLSGKFNERKDNAIISHSGFIGIDIDDVDPEETKSLICPDPYCYAAFTSIRGRGLCVIFKINGEKHREAYSAISEYLFDKYKVITDPTSVNPSRARFVSFDPHIWINTTADKFTALPRKKAEKKVPEIIYIQTDFDLIIQEITNRKIDITGGYKEWLNIGFAISDKFGEGGRNYFHNISQFSSTYSSKITDKQYTNCLKARKSGITIATFYYYAKNAGVSTTSPQTRLITKASYFAKTGGRTQESVVTLLKDAEGISADQSRDIIAQVFENNIKPPSEESLIEQIREWLKMEYNVKRNEITRKIEVNDKEMDDVIFNDVFCASKILFEKINAELLQRIIYSSHTVVYNPFFDFFSKYSHSKPKGVIKDFFGCIDSDTGVREGEFFPDYTYYFCSRWLVGLVASMHGKHSPLMLVFSGAQGNGKTEFFRQILPTELLPYFAESKMDNGKDDDILMCKKILIFDDEMSGKSKKEEKRMKELLSKAVITVREPYGRFSLDMKRIAVFCGTTNDQDILNDPTGNRRIIPVHIISIDFDKINKIDRVSLIMEAYWMYKEGFKWEISGEAVKVLNDNTGYFEQPSPEYDLLTKFYRLPDLGANYPQFLTTTEIKSFIETRTQQKLSITKIGIELKKIGAERVAKKVNGCTLRGYNLIESSLPVAGLPLG
jgi:hypothetical protein